jgi:hypothetical protein
MNKLTSVSSLFVFLLALSVAGCASKTTKKDCVDADPYQLGLKDGSNGRTSDQFNAFRNTCVGEGEPIATDRYDYGRKVGLAQYCSDSRAQDDVDTGKTDSICQKENVPPYQTAYQKALGNKKNKDQAELQDLQKQQDKIRARQTEVQGNLNQINGQPAPTAGAGVPAGQ